MHLGKWNMQGKLRQAGLLLATGLSVDAWQEHILLNITVLSVCVTERNSTHSSIPTLSVSSSLIVKTRWIHLERFRVTARKVEEQTIILPEPVRSSMFLRRSTLDDAQISPITGQVGSKNCSQDMADALDTTFGQVAW